MPLDLRWKQSLRRTKKDARRRPRSRPARWWVVGVPQLRRRRGAGRAGTRVRKVGSLKTWLRDACRVAIFVRRRLPSVPRLPTVRLTLGSGPARCLGTEPYGCREHPRETLRHSRAGVRSVPPGPTNFFSNVRRSARCTAPGRVSATRRADDPPNGRGGAGREGRIRTFQPADSPPVRRTARAPAVVEVTSGIGGGGGVWSGLGPPAL